MEILKIRDGFVNKKENLVSFYENVIKKIEEKKDLNIFIDFSSDKIRERVKFLNDKLERGEKLGSLFGISVSVKDNILVKGLRNTCGSKSLENFMPIYNATIIDRLLEEDAVILGKVNMDEFAMGSSSETSYFGVTKNPLDNTLIPGGSSSGSAASVSSDIAMISLGSDTGGSVRNPAAYCSCVGYKPTYGMISRYGVVSMSNSLDQVGVLSSDVESIFPVMNAISGLDEMDPTSMREKILLNKNPDFSLNGMKIAIVSNLEKYNTNEIILNDYYKAIETLKSLGAKTEVVDFEYIKYSTNVYNVIMSCEVSSNMSRFDGIRYGYRTDSYDSTKELFTNTRSEGFGEEVQRRIAMGTFYLASSNNQELYKKGLKVRDLISKEVNEVLSKYDFILTPTSTCLPPKIGAGKDDALSAYAGDTFNVPVNFAGLCAISVPVNSGKIAGSVQFIGKRFDDERLLNLASTFERGL
ncbi:MAG: Asp-tRNA(Asn)/Glu-tRNA(Gln) amidotransferase subunit GatA [Peptoniphilaceae bacterium]|uniref:Asp-tRNA(Asn)/Glu-tRNA(Gln) amidotransferase subunit GatA n=1 Tax=Parvimonas sp. TaxID=1944660 RepID=UPI0025D4CCF5|nr:Asp-tRNA(Asn)/Glu-tRNA(Gln) amidotransferase subunit GatA [Parvimonas sp.]MCI5997204.1 Asp-tRNA(Asn)/Glu-tRNA(Gln) amidotransferase subunit GatA [Parvimonas sp.]MDD7764297.1 Asp-tRNA(Asn)/Glu-tRNA(Gln) amidotransferase subunit GatA [Peptoniphilaceae bacterium]MDY3051560.1 Asp-tRNA(Asn)/Glu-tRNA(Gln) amidotransferase subunit GatA [Parvimonas sp.]